MINYICTYLDYIGLVHVLTQRLFDVMFGKECVWKRFELLSHIMSVFSHCLSMFMIPDPELS